MSKLRILTGAQLALLFNNGRAGVIPRGDSIGKAIFAPGTIFGAWLSFLGNLLWKGKIVDADGRGLINKILGFKLIRANVFHGVSWSDSREAIVIDYKATSVVAFFIRDEIRCVAPGLYLGRVYIRMPLKYRFCALWFALEFKR